MEEHKDIFDRLMTLPVLSKLAPFYLRHKSVLLYLFFGALTTLVSIGTFELCLLFMDALLANVPSWIAAVGFAYVTNRTWVFSSQAKGIGIFREACTFYGGRIVTFLLEEVILYVFITLLFLPPLTVKILAQVVVLVLNYVISKLIVFKK